MNKNIGYAVVFVAVGFMGYLFLDEKLLVNALLGGFMAFCAWLITPSKKAEKGDEDAVAESQIYEEDYSEKQRIRKAEITFVLICVIGYIANNRVVTILLLLTWVGLLIWLFVKGKKAETIPNSKPV